MERFKYGRIASLVRSGIVLVSVRIRLFGKNKEKKEKKEIRLFPIAPFGIMIYYEAF